ncbi:MAG: amidohydrolase family protein, partial [Pseudomonadota bacterium]
MSFVMGCTLALAGCDNVEILLWQTPEERAASQSDDDPELEAQLDDEEDEDDLPPVEPRTTAETDEQTETISDPEQPFSDSIDETLVIEDVLILTMTDRGAITGRVIIEEGIIKGVGDDIPLMPDESAVTVIDGNGYTLLPGLADMHTHYWQPEEGILFLANGITTVRNMWGTEIAIRLDEGAKNGAFPGPQVFTPGPLMDGADPFWGERSLVVTSPQMARGAVRAQKAAGFQAIKLHKKIDRQSFEAAVDEAKTQGLQVYTHTPLSMNVRDVLAAGTDSLEHLDGVSAALTNQDAKSTGGTLPISQWSDVSRSQMKPLANAFAKSSVASVPTFTAINTRYQSMLDPDRFFEKPDAAYLTFAVKDWWLETADTARGELRKQEINSARANQLAFVKALHDAGAELLIGTDSPN